MARSADPDWRTRHCAEAVVERVNHATGRDLWAEMGGCPRSWREAADLYRRLGVTNLADAVSAMLGPPIDRKLARRGDIVLAGKALGICRGELAEFVNGVESMKQVDAAWRADG